VTARLRARLLGWAVLLAALAAGCAPDPIVGSWRIQRGPSAVLLDFRPDGTVGLNVEALGTPARPTPPTDPTAARAAERTERRFARASLTWRRTGTLYRVEGDLPGAAARTSHLKREGDRLLPCDAAGNPVGGSVAVRAAP
jgi:hypothetical protein